MEAASPPTPADTPLDILGQLERKIGGSPESWSSVKGGDAFAHDRESETSDNFNLYVTNRPKIKKSAKPPLRLIAAIVSEEPVAEVSSSCCERMQHENLLRCREIVAAARGEFGHSGIMRRF